MWVPPCFPDFIHALTRSFESRGHAVLIVISVSLGFQSVWAETGPEFVGSSRCAQCHENEYQAWRGSHHALAMAEATETTVLGNFDNVEFTAHGVTSTFFRKADEHYVRTDGPDGELHDYRIAYTFGWYPLQQYLIQFPRGNIQALGIAWDSRPADQGGQRWFHLYPDEHVDHDHALHWTGREQRWNYQCSECHSTDLQKNYNLADDGYATTWSEINVACEACHGPGSDHVAWAERSPKNQDDAHKGLVLDLADRAGGQWIADTKTGKPRRTAPRTSHAEIELCARCHSRRGQIWQDYQVGGPLLDTHRLSLLEEHLYFPDGQIKDEVYVYGSFIQSRMYRAGVTCSDCHQPHTLKLKAEGNAVCTRCHGADRYDTPDHHHHKTGTDQAACTACHMPQRQYMVIDERADHSLRVPRPDISVKLGTPNACSGCHADRSPEWAQAAVEKWYPESTHRGPHFGEALQAARHNRRDAERLLLSVITDSAQPGIARATALTRLADRPAPSHLSALKAALDDDDPLMRIAAMDFLEQADIRTRIDLGWPLLDDPVRTVRLEAARVLSPLMAERLPDKFRRQLQKRIEEYEAAQGVNLERPESHLNLGVMAINQGRARKAEAAYRQALRLDPEFVPATVNLADLYRQLGQEQEGQQVLLDGIEANPLDPSLHHALGLLQVRRNQLDKATRSLARATELAPGNNHYTYVYALALEKAGVHDKAADTLAKVLRQDPAHRDAAVTLANLYIKTGNTKAAGEVIRAIRRNAPEDPRIDWLEKRLKADQ